MSQASQFNKTLKRADLVALAFGAMIGWGWVVLSGKWIVSAGLLGTSIALVVGGATIIFIGLVYAELASAMPQAGGEHVYSKRALGQRASFVCTWAIILGYLSVIAFEAVALPTVIEYFSEAYQFNYKRGLLWQVAGYDVYLTWALIGVLATILITWLNIRGIGIVSFAQKVVVIGIVAVGLWLIVGTVLQPEVRISYYQLLSDKGLNGVFSVLVMIPFMFVGFDVIPQAAEEANLKPQYIGRMLIVSIGVAIVWYILIALATGLLMSAEELQSSDYAVAYAMQKVVGAAWGADILIIAGICGILTTWNALVVAASRAIYALAEDGLLPASLGKMHPKYRTPVNAILLVGAFSILAPWLGRKSLVWFVDAGGVAIIIAYILVVISFLVLRHREPNMQRPFKVTCGKAIGYLALVFSIVLFILYLPGSPAALIKEEWMIVAGCSVIGAVLYLFAGTTRHRVV